MAALGLGGTAQNLGFEVRDPQRFASNMAQLVGETGKAVSAFLQPQIGDPAQSTISDEFAPIAKTFARVQQAWLTQPGTVFEAQTKLWQSYAGLWSSTMLKAMGMGGGEAAHSVSKDTASRTLPGRRTPSST